MSALSPETAALGRAVRALREERGVSQVQLAADTGFMQSWISNVEHGRRNPSWSNVVRLAEGLGVNTGELVTRAEAQAAEPEASTLRRLDSREALGVQVADVSPCGGLVSSFHS